jgi:hypothetical protein
LTPSFDAGQARVFLATHGRVLDRRRLGRMLDGEPAEGVLDALLAYRNADGGFGWGLEPDLRAPSSQPVGALHAFELLEETGLADDAVSVPLCHWLAAESLADGGLPFALVGADAPGTAPWFAQADPRRSSLHITSAICGVAHRLRPESPAIAGHPWLDQATEYCCAAIARLGEPGGSYELKYVLQFLDAIVDVAPEAEGELVRMAAFLPASWRRPVAGGLADEHLGPLDFSPRPQGALRTLVPPDVIARDLERLAAEQAGDGGWPLSWATSSPAAALEWRGAVTVRAAALLLANAS